MSILHEPKKQNLVPAAVYWVLGVVPDVSCSKRYIPLIEFLSSSVIVNFIFYSLVINIHHNILGEFFPKIFPEFFFKYWG
jgi:hypothetical protein